MDEDRIPLIAKEGYIYTNGKDTHGIVIYVEVGKDDKEYYPITLEEYEHRFNTDESVLATEEDYQNILCESEVNL